jgi:hypothetical protein
MNEIRIKLDEDDFQCLVSGGVLTIKDNKNKQEILIYLADIGLHIMDKCIGNVDTKKIQSYSHRDREI